MVLPPCIRPCLRLPQGLSQLSCAVAQNRRIQASIIQTTQRSKFKFSFPSNLTIGFEKRGGGSNKP